MKIINELKFRNKR